MPESSPAQSAESVARLTAAYHLIFDVKDTTTPGSHETAALSRVLYELGNFLRDIDPALVPRRFDKERSA